MLMEPTSTPSPMRPTRPRSASSSSSRVRVKTSRATDSSTRPGRPGGRGPAPPARPPSARPVASWPGASHRRTASAGGLGPRRPASPHGSGLGGGLGQVVDQAQDELRGARAPGPHRGAGVRPATRCVGIGFGQSRFASLSSAKVIQAVVPVMFRPATTPRRGTVVPRRSREESAALRRRRRRPARRRRPRAGSRCRAARELQQGAAHHPGRQGHDGGTVERDAGGGQLLVGQPGVGLGAGVQDGHAVERRPRPGASTMARTAARTSSSQSETVTIRVRSASTTSMGIVVARVRPALCPVRAAVPTARPRRRPAHHRWSRPDHHETSLAGHGAQQCATVARQPLGQVDDDGAETATADSGPQDLGTVEQVLLVVERPIRG
jgi:hypothetical protein